jgi:hypothetical protein
MRSSPAVSLLLPLLCLAPGVSSAEQDRWKIQPDGSIAWEIKRGDPGHQDQIEMSGRKVSAIVTYGVRADGSLTLSRQVVFPTLRTIPNDTHASLSYTFDDTGPRMFISSKPARQAINRIMHRGVITIESSIGQNGEVALTRTLFPSVDKPAYLERYTFTNKSPQATSIEMESAVKTIRTAAARGVSGEYVICSELLDPGVRTLKPAESTSFAVAFTARESRAWPLALNPAAEEQARRARIESFWNRLQLDTPDPVLNAAFAFAKIRAAESIYETKGGLMHGPGGGAYYAAIWANDQAEYANPFFAFLGDATATESAINAYRHFARYMNPDYKPIPSSIVAEGTSFWNGAGDRGDMAMIAYGASRFALANGDRSTAAELWKLISWSLEYCRRKLTADGVVASDSDELEGRFPAGKANLSTSSLYYDALRSASLLARELGEPDPYGSEAESLRGAIERYFGARVQGFDTYRYYDGNTKLRAWICVPLAMGIFDRKRGTLDALFSPALWTADGVATESGEKTFWDRATLYALRGAFAAGETERALDFLGRYSARRLLGEHVPYPVEAWPEGNQRHLSAESALYCRIFTEGLFGMRPTGLRSFTATPRLPKGWPSMRLNAIHAFGTVFNLSVTREAGKLRVEVQMEGKPPVVRTAAEGESIAIVLND